MYLKVYKRSAKCAKYRGGGKRSDVDQILTDFASFSFKEYDHWSAF